MLRAWGSLSVVAVACGQTSDVPNDAPVYAVGTISLRNSNERVRGLAHAIFTPRDTANCPSLTIDVCEVHQPCGPSQPVYYSAGSISVTGGNEQIALKPQNDGSYAVHSSDGRLFGVGDVISARADGHMISSFSVSVTAEDQATITTRYTDTTAINSNVDAPIAWSGVSRGFIIVSFQDASDPRLWFACRFSAEHGTAAIPAAVFDQFAGHAGRMTFSSYASATVDTDDALVELLVGHEGVWDDGSSAWTNVSIQ